MKLLRARTTTQQQQPATWCGQVPMEPAMMDIGTPVNCTVPGIPPGSSRVAQEADGAPGVF